MPYESGDQGWLPAFPQLCAALTPASRLRSVFTSADFADGRMAAQLAAALAPGRSRIESLEFVSCDLSDEDGCAASACVAAAAMFSVVRGQRRIISAAARQLAR